MVVCFDIGGVLSRLRTRWEDCARAAGIDPVPDHVRGRSITELPFFDAYQAGDFDDEAFLVRFAEWLGGVDRDRALAAHQAILVGPYPGTEELIDELNADGIPTACLSNTNEFHWQVMLAGELLPQIPKLRHPVASHRLGLAKPDPAIFRRFEAIVGARPEEIVFFEDGPKNVDGARACGWDAVWIDPEGDPAWQMRRELAIRGWGG